MTSIRLLRNANQPSNILSELNRQRKKNQLCEITFVVGGEKLFAHQCVLAACSGYFHKLFTVDKKGANGGELEIPLKRVTFRGMKDVLDYVYGDVIFVSEDSIDELLRSTLALSVKDLLNDLTKYMMSILDVRNCLRMLSISRGCSLTRFSKSVKKFICENLEAVSAQENFYFLAKSDLKKILSSEDVMLDCESHLYEVILKWVKFDPESRLKHFPDLFSKVRLQFVPQDYLLDIVRHEELVKEFPACVTAVTEAMYFHLNPEAAMKETARLKKEPEHVDLLLSTGTNLVGYYDDNVKVIQKCEDCPDLTQASFAIHGSNAYACGGIRENMTSCLVRHFDGKVWTRLPSMSSERVGTALACFKGKLLAFGGSLDVQPIKGLFTDKVELLDKTINEWITVGTSPSFRSNSCAVSSEFSVFVLGGLSCPNGIAKSKCCSVVEVYHPSSNLWTIGPNMTKERCDFSAQSIKQQIFVFGGDVSGANTMETFHLLDNAWTMVTTELPIPLRQIYSASHGNSICLADVSVDSITVWRSIIDYGTDVMWKKEMEEKRMQTPELKSIQLNQTWRESLDKLREADRKNASFQNTFQQDTAVLVGFKTIYVLRKDSEKIHQFEIRHPNTTDVHRLCYARDGAKLVFCGGSSINASQKVTQCINEGWTSHSEQWTDLPGLDQPVCQPVAVFVGGIPYLFGGVLETSGERKVLTSSIRLNSLLKKWEKLRPMPVGKHSSVSVHIKGMIYILGGWTDVEPIGFNSLSNVQATTQQKGCSSVDVYSPEKNEWTVGPAMPDGFAGMLCAEVYEDNIYVINKSNLCNFDVRTKIWTVLCHLPFCDSLITSSMCGSTLYIALVRSPCQVFWRCNLSQDILKWEKVATSSADTKGF